MNGRRTRSFGCSLCIAVFAMLFAGAPGNLKAADHSDGRQGRLGSSHENDVMNFSDLAARNAGVRASERTRLDQVRRKQSVRPVRRPGNGLVDGANQTFAAASSDGEVSEPIFTAASSLPSPPPSASFLALADNAVSFNPDTQGAVGLNHLMVTLGSEVRIQNRSGGVISTVSLDAFWGALGQNTVFDPRVIYDFTNHRWITTAINNPGTNNANLLLAVSQTSDPTGNWYRHAIRVDLVDGVYASSPNIGLSRDWITIQANMRDQTGLFFFSSDIFTFNKTSLYAGGAANHSRFYYFPAGEFGTPVPAVNYDPAFGTNYLVADAGILGGLGRLRLFTISGPVDNPFFNEFGAGNFIAAGPAFGSPTWLNISPFNDNFAPQLGTTNKIFIGDSRIQNVVYRNGALWATHHVFLPTNGASRCSIQWWGFSPGGTVIHHGRIDDPTGGRFYAYPSIAVNRYEDVVIGYTRFAANQYPSANYAFHGFADGPGRLRTDTVLKAGEAKFTVFDFDLILWGDWSGTVVDPANDVDLWTIQEYAAVPVLGVERWGTWWGRISPPTSLSLNVTDSPDPLIAGSTVTYSIQVTNNFGQVATGVRLVDTLPPGAAFVSASLSQGSCQHSNGVVTCDIGNMPGAVGGGGVISGTIVAVLNQGGTATNRVVVSSFGPDALSSDNTKTVLTTVSTASDLSVTLAAEPELVILGNNVTYTMTVTNLGPSTASSVFATNVIPAGVTYLSASTSQGSCSHSGGRVTCSLGTLAVNARAIITVTIRANSSGTLNSFATAKSSSIDPNLGNSSVTLTIKANSLPTLQAISNRTINEDTVLGPIAFTVGDAETPAGNLLLNAFSSNPAVVPPGNIVLGGSGASRSIMVTPAPDANGAVTITRTLTDGDGSVVSSSFVLTITPVNDRPVISDTPSQVVNEDVVLGPLAFQVNDAETSPSFLSLSSASSNPALIPNANILFGGVGVNRTLTIIPTANMSGTASITITVSDGVTSATDMFLVTVNSVNDTPTITDIANQTISEDTSTANLSFSVGDVETPAVALTLSGRSSDITLVPTGNITFGGSGANRTVRVAPAPNRFGAAIITVTVTDGDAGTGSDIFLVTVTPANDFPSMSGIGSRTISEDAGVQTVAFAGVTAGPNNEIQTITITATSSNPSLIPNPVTVSYFSPSSMGSLSFASATNASGVANITVTVNDGGTSNNIITRVFTVTVLAVNDAPFVSAIAPVTIDEDASTGLIAFTIGDVESSAASLSVSGNSSNTALVPNGNILFGGSGSNRTVSVTPAPDQFGAVNISILVSDGETTSTRVFNLTVLPVNDLPSIASVANQSINEDEPASIAVTISDLETPASSLALYVSSSNPSLISGMSFGGSAGVRTLNIVPATNQSGSATMTVTVIDSDGGSNSIAFALSLLPVNDLPTLDAIADIVIEEDASRQTVLLAGISSGAPDEIQTLTVSEVADGTTLVTNLAVSYSTPGSAGSLQFDIVPDANGTAAVTVTVGDGQGTSSRTFNVVVLPINDLPSISPVADIAIDEDTTVPVPFVIGDLETPADQLTVQAVSSNPELLDETGISFIGSGANRSILLTPLLDQSDASTIITITVTDGNGAVAQTSFELSVRPVNDAPVISGLSDITISEDAASGPIPILVTDAEALPSSLLVSAFSSNHALLPDENVVMEGEWFNRTLSLVPAGNQFGSAMVSVVAWDGVDAGAIVTNTFLLTVTPVNDAPTLGAIDSIVVPMNAGLQTVNLTGIGTGATNEFQTLTVTATSSDPALIPNPVVDYSSSSTVGTLRISPLPNVVGTVQITVTVTDDGGSLDGGTNQTSRTFSVQISDAGPMLMITRLSNQVVVSWSTNSPLIWTLQSTTNVAASSSWSAVVEVPVIVDGRYTVTNSMGGPIRFYRLKNEKEPGLALSIAHISGQVIVSWSTNSALNWSLESSTNVAVAASWSAVNVPPVVVNGRHNVTNAATGGAQFYRLRSQ